MQGIYLFRNTINNKVYIGKSIDLENRYLSHLRNYTNENLDDYDTKFYRALRKYGFHNFDYNILEQQSFYTEEELNEKEIYYISYYNATDDNFGYNIQKGGKDTAVPRKLTEAQILAIKQEIISSSISFEEIAQKFSVSCSMISMINSGKAWPNIGEHNFPLRENCYIKNIGGHNPNAIFSDEEIIQIRLLFVDRTLPEIYEMYKNRCSFSEMKKICYGVQFKHLPVYKKRDKKWFLNNTCIDYPRLEEYCSY